MSRSYVSMSRHPHMVEPSRARSANYQLADGRTVSGEKLLRLLTQDGSATAAVALLLAKGDSAPPLAAGDGSSRDHRGSG